MMRRLALFVACSVFATQTGCQNFGSSGYPMQSVTRVPPPATGSYPMGGSYYNAPAGAPTSMAPGTTSMAPGSNASAGFTSSNTAAPVGNLTQQPNSTPSSYVNQAQYTASSGTANFGSATSSLIPGQPVSQQPVSQQPVSQQPVSQQPVSQQPSSTNMPSLNWQ